MTNRATNSGQASSGLRGEASLPALSLRSLVLGFGTTHVASISEFHVMSSEVVAIIGRSGIGKTTLLSAISGMTEPLAGSICIDGRECEPKVRLQLTARTLQNFPLLHWLTVEGNLQLAADIRGRSRIDASAILARFRADHLLDRFPKTLSGGERCRASLAQAVIGNPRILLLDEPFSSLDTLVKVDVAESLFAFARQQQAAVLFVTHDLHDACEFADRALVLAGSRPARVGGMVNTRSPDALDHIRRLLSSSPEEVV